MFLVLILADFSDCFQWFHGSFHSPQTVDLLLQTPTPKKGSLIDVSKIIHPQNCGGPLICQAGTKPFVFLVSFVAVTFRGPARGREAGRSQGILLALNVHSGFRA